MKQFTFFVFLFFVCCYTSYCQTIVGGSIFSDSTWNVAGSPYIVNADVIVYPNVTLTISPGVTVKFDNGTRMEVRGQLVAIGNAVDSIYFTSSGTNPVPGVWEEIKVENTTTFSYVSLSYSNHGVRIGNILYMHLNINNSSFESNETCGIESAGDSSVIEYCDFRNNTFSGIQGITRMYTSVWPRVSYCSFMNNRTGIGNVDDGGIISNCTFLNNSVYGFGGHKGFYLGNISRNNAIGCSMNFSSGCKFQGNIISDNNIGVLVKAYPNSIVNYVYNNTICNNSQFNVHNTETIDIDFSNNCWCTNDSLLIGDLIWDAHDSSGLGIITYSPFLNNCNLAVDEIPEPYVVTIFPNPLSSTINVKTNNNDKSEIILFDIHMKKIISEEFISETSIDTQGLKGGVYIYKIRIGEVAFKTGKLILVQ